MRNNSKYLILYLMLISSSLHAKRPAIGEQAFEHIIPTLEQLCMDNNLQIMSFGGGNTGCVRKHCFTLECKNTADLKMARFMYYKIIQTLLNTINADMSLRLYLQEYPLSLKQLSIQVGFKEDPSNNYLDQIHLITPRKGKIYYSIMSQQTKKYEEVYSETFEELENFVNANNVVPLGENKRQFPDNFCLYSDKKVKNYLITKTTDYPGGKEITDNYILVESIGKKIADYLDLVFLDVASTLMFETHLGHESFGFAFASDKKLDIEQAKSLAHNLFQIAYHHLTHDKRFSVFLEWCYRDQKNKEVIDKTYLLFRINFWDEQLELMGVPYIAQINCVNGKLSYMQKDPTTGYLKEVYVESVDSI